MRPTPSSVMRVLTETHGARLSVTHVRLGVCAYTLAFPGAGGKVWWVKPTPAVVEGSADAEAYETERWDGKRTVWSDLTEALLAIRAWAAGYPWVETNDKEEVI